MTQRLADTNGWIVIKDNPISKIGVFEYLGSRISAPEPDKIYRVYRPESSLNNPETIDSFKLLPWVDDHRLLGNLGVPAEQKGIEGITGENVYYEAPYLKATIKVLSTSLADKIRGGKIELSVGYRCKYELVSGTTPEGEPYDAIQTQMRGNHLALVDEGRMGPDVAVLDHDDSYHFTVDSKDISMPPETETSAAQPSMADLLSAIMALTAMLKPAEKADPAPAATPDAEDPAKGAPAADPEKKPGTDAEDPEDPEKDDAAKKKDGAGEDAKDRQIAALTKRLANLETNGMDSVLAGVAKRDALYSQVAPLTGAFDHAAMNETAVAKYAVKALGLTGCDGNEVVALSAYLQASAGHKKTALFGTSAMDGATGNSALDAYIKGA